MVSEKAKAKAAEILERQAKRGGVPFVSGEDLKDLATALDEFARDDRTLKELSLNVTEIQKAFDDGKQKGRAEVYKEVGEIKEMGEDLVRQGERQAFARLERLAERCNNGFCVYTSVDGNGYILKGNDGRVVLEPTLQSAVEQAEEVGK